jgi:hypothetical protein
MSNPGLDRVLSVTAEEITRGFLKTMKERKKELIKKIGQEKYDRVLAQLEKEVAEYDNSSN